MVYRHSPHKSHDDILVGAQMNAKCHIWVSVCVVMTSMWGKNFQYIHLLEAHHYIETTNVSINQSNFSRVCFLHSSIHVEFEAIIFSCFKLENFLQFVVFKHYKFGYHDISSNINFIFFLLTTIHWDHRITNWINNL